MELTQQQLLNLISKRYKKSDRQLKRYLRKYEEGERAENGSGLEALLPEKVICNSRKDERILIINHPRNKKLVLDEIKVRIPAECLPIVKEVLEKEYLKPKKISKATAYRSIEALCTKLGLDSPPYITISNIIDKIDPTVIARMREGKAVSQSLKLVNRGFTNDEPLFPLHIVQIDHCKLPIKLIEENTGEVIYGVWLTLGMCLYSRAIWCYHLSFEDPSKNKTRKALENGIFPKNAKKEYDTINEWPVFGIPQIIYTDNGSDFKSKDIRTLVNTTLKSQIRYRPVGAPNYGGAIESCFGTISKEFIEGLHGSFKKRKLPTPDYDPDKEACLTFEEFRKLLIWYIVDVYHYDIHEELPYQSPSPILRYTEGCDMFGEPPWVSKEQEESLRIELLPMDEKGLPEMVSLSKRLFILPRLWPTMSVTKENNLRYGTTMKTSQKYISLSLTVSM